MLQSTWLSNLPTSSYRIDLLLPAVVYLGFSCRRRYALPILLVIGTLYDAESAGPFGMALCSYFTIYLLIRLVITKITYQSMIQRFMWVGIASLLDKGICAVLIFVWGYQASIIESFLSRAPIQALIDSATGLALIPFLAWYSDLRWSKLFTPKKIVIGR